MISFGSVRGCARHACRTCSLLRSWGYSAGAAEAVDSAAGVDLRGMVDLLAIGFLETHHDDSTFVGGSVYGALATIDSQ